MRRDPKHAEELDNKLQENVVQKNHLLQVLNKEDLEGQFSKLVEGLSDAKSSGDSITVLYGSETGNAEEQAKNLMQDLIARGLKSTVSSLDDFEFDELPNQKIVILVVSTCGLGEYPAQLQADLAEAPISGSANVLAGRCEVLRLRPGRLHLQPVLCGCCRLRHPLGRAWRAAHAEARRGR